MNRAAGRWSSGLARACAFAALVFFVVLILGGVGVAAGWSAARQHLEYTHQSITAGAELPEQSDPAGVKVLARVENESVIVLLLDAPCPLFARAAAQGVRAGLVLLKDSGRRIRACWKWLDDGRAFLVDERLDSGVVEFGRGA